MAITPWGSDRRSVSNVIWDSGVRGLGFSPFFFSKEQITDKTDAFRIAEIIREKLIRVTGKEVPYSLAVTVESIEYKNKMAYIDAVIWVERTGQKKIIIGTGGEKLKEIGKRARRDIEKLLGKKVFISLWVKVKEGWSEQDKTLDRFGF